ncbi:polysaccharide deacetylase family protein [Caenimonas terrae]|uniref:Polysaccharide deacetylase family protein n=1 Tax=Caenimonas terrae TaxID=696074 RepID=A0ABW0NK95_9BURK
MRRPIPILTYHQVDAPPDKGVPYRSLVVSPAAFARQMAMLRMLGYRGLCMSALEPYLRGDKKGRVVGITLDDGYVNNLQHALPVLRRHGFSATCYVVSGQMGGSNVWDRDKGIPARPLMDAAQLKAWVAGGQEVGAHTRNHVDLVRAGDTEAFDEIVGCKRELEHRVEAPVRHFCYPYGAHETKHAAMAKAVGYRTATTTQRSRARAGDDLFELPRVPVLRTTSLPLLWLKIATGYEDRKRR